MKSVPAGEVADQIGATALGDPGALVGPDVIIDSRLASPGCLFFALPGERVDGHDFVSAAFAGGAAAAVVSREVPSVGTQLVVPDVAKALADLARAQVQQAADAGLVTVAITGSSGKTSTKDLIAQLLTGVGPVVAPVGSQNNEIGVPLTAARVNDDTAFLVSEFGARGLGHISWLCGVVPPQIGVVVNVGLAHLGEFGDVETIALAKGELVEALPAHGWAVLNAQDEQVAAMAGRTRAQVATFAVGEEPSFGLLRVWASEVATDDRMRPGFWLHAAGRAEGSQWVQLHVSGAHQVANAVAAAAVGLLCGLDVAQVAAGLGQAEPKSRWRMELLDAPNGVLVINDAYNANPDSMAAALRALAGLRRPGARLHAVLGDMLELGESSPLRHREVGQLAAELGVDEVIAIGSFAEEIAAAAREGGATVAVVGSADEAATWTQSRLACGDVVLVKASRGLALESVAQRLVDGVTAESEQ